ncbi:hypothetical protein [Pedobacter jamesrossensis]|uniref:Uncharacterized protein n=1 Tax=Pedobacter jamesrossensis TaxID=1908238 RepID=A0ABV8NRW5_9SPHI
MDLHTAIQIEKSIQNTDKLSGADYLEQLSRIEEKFRIWKNKNFLQRVSIFRKLPELSRNHGDNLSEWVLSEMGIIVDNSEIG